MCGITPSLKTRFKLIYITTTVLKFELNKQLKFLPDVLRLDCLSAAQSLADRCGDTSRLTISIDIFIEFYVVFIVFIVV